MKKKIYLDTSKVDEVIKRLKNGEVIHVEGSEGDIKMIEGVIVQKLKRGMGISFGFSIDDNEKYYYFEEEEKFEITETGVYKTRDGRKVFISKVEWYAFGIIEGTTEIHDWYVSGQYASCTQHEMDIVSKWED